MYDIWAEHESPLDTFHTGLLLPLPEDPSTTWTPPADDDRLDTLALTIQSMDAGESDPAPPIWAFADDPFVEGPSSGLIASVSPGDDPLIDNPMYVPPTDLGDVIVVGYPDNPILVPPPPVTGGGGGGGGGPIGDTTGWDPEARNRAWDDCEDREADTLADEINREIQRQADHAYREYGALIWRDAAGDLHRTPLIAGNNWRLSGLDNITAQQFGFDSLSRVVSIVHSHPTMVDPGPEHSPTGQYQAVSPESHYERLGSGDIEVADSWISNNFANKNNFSMYISFMGTVKEFDYSDNSNRNISFDARSAAAKESDDYRPGTTC